MTRTCNRALFTTSLLLGALFLLGSVYAQERSSENNETLKRALERYPKADANEDGVLTLSEATAYRDSVLNGRQGSPSNRVDNSPRIAPTHTDVAYGPYAANRFDIWIAESEYPTPLVVCIHGGGFSGGDKSTYHRQAMVGQLLEEGISVATINYRLTEGGKNPFPIPMNDAARAIQFLRFKSKEYNLDKARIATLGGSAGGCLSMWLAYHEDVADPFSDDPVLRESTRLTCIAPSAGQSTLDFTTLAEWFECDVLKEHGGGRPLFAIPKDVEFEKAIRTPKLQTAMREASPITHLTHDDPPAFLTYSRGDEPVDETTEPNVWVHHPRLGIKLKEQADKLGVPCYVQYPGGPKIEEYESSTEFLIRLLKSEDVTE